MPEKVDEPRHYPRPPITEAVIELRSGSALTPRDLERCRDRFKRQYETVESVNEIEVTLQPDGKATNRVKSSGYKMTARNAVGTVILTPFSLATIRLAPYQQWENLLQSAKENLETFAKVVGRQPIVRLATRFINRIDIPNNQYNAARTKDFVTFGASVPGQIAESVTAHFATANFTIENGIKLVVQSGPINPVLLDHSSILLDIDAAIEADIPTRIDDMWEKTEILRAAKNRVFESSITDRCRELFK
jgi:uncharacterized protein (TIGR04255 family)